MPADPAARDTMQAIVYRRYGSPDVLALEEVARPAIGDDEILVRVRAASVNALDWHLLRGHPYLVRATAGLLRPKRNIPGVDLAGVVEAVGGKVTEFAPGDEVFGERSRACAEYVRTTAELLVHKPATLSFEAAAAIPAAGVTALQALRDKGNLQPGQRVLVNGAAGGVGTFSVQVAKALGAHVTAVCSARNVEQSRRLGADEVIDYARDDFTRGADRYDLIIDNAANRSLQEMRRVLSPTGTVVLVGAPPGRWFGFLLRMWRAGRLSKDGGQRFLSHLTETTRADLLTLRELVEAGSVTPVVERCQPLAETPDAIRYLETLHARGKVVIKVAGA